MESEIKLCLQLAFEAGRWMGQVDLEKHMDNEQYSEALLQSYISHTKCIQPSECHNREVVYNLRSNEWRKGVEISANEYLKKAEGILTKYLTKYK